MLEYNIEVNRGKQLGIIKNEALWFISLKIVVIYVYK